MEERIFPGEALRGFRPGQTALLLQPREPRLSGQPAEFLFFPGRSLQGDFGPGIVREAGGICGDQGALREFPYFHQAASAYVG